MKVRIINRSSFPLPEYATITDSSEQTVPESQRAALPERRASCEEATWIL